MNSFAPLQRLLLLLGLVALAAPYGACDLEQTCSERYTECSNGCRDDGVPVQQQVCQRQCEDDYRSCGG